MSGWCDAQDLVQDLATISMPSVFNPYRDHCNDYDVDDAASIRAANLTAVLDQAIIWGVDELWVGLELGRLGGRRTGLPLTDEPSLAACGTYWQLAGLRRATDGPAAKEQTATYVWRAMATGQRKVFFWNAFPFHCHLPGSANNRSHTPAEIDKLPAITPWLIDRLRIRTVVSLGQKAETALRRMGIASRYVRHPGRGGGPAFLQSIHAS